MSNPGVATIFLKKPLPEEAAFLLPEKPVSQIIISRPTMHGGKHKDAHKILQAGGRGTRRWQAVYGEKLLNVRYRYDGIQGIRVTTVEVIVEEKTIYTVIAVDQ